MKLLRLGWSHSSIHCNMTNKVQIISFEEAYRLAHQWPNDISFGRRFAKFHTLRYHLETQFVHISAGDDSVLFPIQYGKGIVHAVHKGHTEPLFLGKHHEVDWQAITRKVRRITRSRLFLGDFALPLEKSKGLIALPLATFVFVIRGRNIDDLFGSYRKTTRNLVRRSQEKGFHIKISSGNFSDDLYHLYEKHQQSLGTPPKSRDFFDQLAVSFGDGLVAISIWDGEKPIGLNLVLSEGPAAWLSINSSYVAYHDSHINYLLYHELLRWACANGVKRIDFGGSSTREDNIHNSFKLGFGAEMIPLYRLIDGSISARFSDWWNRKKRNLQIRRNKLWNSWRN